MVRKKGTIKNKPIEYTRARFSEMGIESGDEIWVVTKHVDARPREPFIPLYDGPLPKDFYPGIYKEFNQNCFALYPRISIRTNRPGEVKAIHVHYSEVLHVEKQAGAKDISSFIERAMLGQSSKR